jgi:hypothetical protein
MGFRGVEPSENFHSVDNFPFLFCLLPFVLLVLLEIEQVSFDYELLPSDPLIESRIVKLDHLIFQLDVLWGIVVEELHVC